MVRLTRAGAPFEYVAAQLGHVRMAVVLRLYGRLKPRVSERRDGERVAATQDDTRSHHA